jgi:hypothetical protein
MGKFGDLTVRRPAKTMLGDAGELLAAPDLFDNGLARVHIREKAQGLSWRRRRQTWAAKCYD